MSRPLGLPGTHLTSALLSSYLLIVHRPAKELCSVPATCINGSGGAIRFPIAVDFQKLVTKRDPKENQGADICTPNASKQGGERPQQHKILAAIDLCLSNPGYIGFVGAIGAVKSLCKQLDAIHKDVPLCQIRLAHPLGQPGSFQKSLQERVLTVKMLVE